MSKYSLILISLSIFTHIVFSQQAQEMLRPNLGEKIGTCDACGMDVFDRMLTKVEITVDDNTFYACAMGCAFGMTEGKVVSSMKVVDFPTVTLVDANNASYVTGSIVVPVRAMMPVFAFKSNNEAETFVEKYGGNVHTFEELKELAIKLREERRR